MGRFNGAATFRSRKAQMTNFAALALRPLQWGRDLSVAEGAARILALARQAKLQWGRDLSVAEG